MNLDGRPSSEQQVDTGHSNKLMPLESFTKIKFAHSTLKLRSNLPRSKQQALVAKEAVSFGTVLAVEYPMIMYSPRCKDKINFKDTRKLDRCAHRIVNEQRALDPEFSAFWDGLELDQVMDMTSFSPQGMDGLKVCQIDTL